VISARKRKRERERLSREKRLGEKVGFKLIMENTRQADSRATFRA